MLAALMARQPVSEELWRQLQPLIPVFVPSAKGGARKLAVSDEAVLNGILFVLQTGIPWEDLPQSLGYGSGMTCWRRLRDWNAGGVWEQLHPAMLTRLREHDQIDWSRGSIDGSSVPSPRWPGNGAQPDGQRQARIQAAHRCRCQRHPAGDLGQRREPARPQDVREVRGRDSCDCRLGRVPSHKTIEVARRQGL